MAIGRVLIANRGEIAVRVARACREAGITSVAVYSDADARALHVRVADRAVRIGPAAPAESYLSVPAIIEAALATRADAVHPGYGFLSERPELPRACTAAGLIFVGPPGDVMERMGSKIGARALMEAAGVPIVPGVTPRDQSDGGVLEAARGLGYPVLVKASAGGGGKGMRVVRVGRRGRRVDRRGAARGDGSVRRRDSLRRAADRASAACRDPGVCRRSRQRRTPLRTRVLGSAPTSEGHRGESFTGGQP